MSVKLEGEWWADMPPDIRELLANRLGIEQGALPLYSASIEAGYVSGIEYGCHCTVCSWLSQRKLGGEDGKGQEG